MVLEQMMPGTLVGCAAGDMRIRVVTTSVAA